jgi:hypothetical protein
MRNRPPKFAPGLADTRGIQQDELHKKNIASEIQKHIGSANAVLILANGAVPRSTVGSDCALCTLSAIFPTLLSYSSTFQVPSLGTSLWKLHQTSSKTLICSSSITPLRFRRSTAVSKVIESNSGDR